MHRLPMLAQKIYDAWLRKKKFMCHNMVIDSIELISKTLTIEAIQKNKHNSRTKFAYFCDSKANVPSSCKTKGSLGLIK
ncbi:unnamed protein product [Schistosoma curassoni]|uniref:Transposase n=1 Tax=Schistosoma curassoni TaxID=6186 RepID=A0A183KC22_9TREM|nr:unnamed protein product [Schistosoma curassoni]